MGALGVVTALTHKAGADKTAKAATRASHRKATSPCICRKADGTVTVIARNKTEGRTIKRALPAVEVRHTMTYTERMAKYGVIGNQD
jgi:hypothetical protein